MIVQCHRVCDDLKAFIKASVRLAVDMLTADVGLPLDSGGAVIVFPSTVNFQLYTEIAVTVAVEDRLRLVAVFLDFSFDAVITAGAVRIIAAPQDIIVMQDPTDLRPIRAALLRASTWPDAWEESRSPSRTW